MNILITSGGTSEKIDQVRSITNHSTGQLGKMIAEHCLAEGASVTLLTTAKAVKPAPHDNLTIKMIEDTEQLLTAMEEMCSFIQWLFLTINQCIWQDLRRFLLVQI